MTTTTRTGAIYGIGIYGVDTYDTSNVSIVPDGVQAVCTTDSGLIITADANHVVVSVVGLGLVGVIGPDQVIGDANVPVVGVVATGAVGDNLTFILGHTELLTGVEGIGNTSAPTVVAKAVTNVTGISSEGICGTVNVTADSVFIVTGVQATGAANDVTIAENARPTFDGVQATGFIGTTVVTVTVFNYEAVKDQYAPQRTVYVDRRSTSLDRTVRVPVSDRIVYVASNQSNNRVVYITAQPRVVIVGRRTTSDDREVLAA
jgi:hypothetical protein